MTTTETRYMVFAADNHVNPVDSITRVEQDAIKKAKECVDYTGRRHDVFKLIQTHTYEMKPCGSCGQDVANGGHVMTGEVAQ